MAYNDSGELPVSQSTYSLGGYTFELKVQTVHEPGEPDVVSVFAICRGPDGTRETQAVDFPSGTTIDYWTVEVNENEASVFVKRESHTDKSIFETLSDNVHIVSVDAASTGGAYKDCKNGKFLTAIQGDTTAVSLIISAWEYSKNVPSNTQYYTSFTICASRYNTGTTSGYDAVGSINRAFTYAGKTVYYAAGRSSHDGPCTDASPVAQGSYFVSGYDLKGDLEKIAWAMVYVTGGEDVEREELVGRFAIDIREADTDSWDEPGDDGPPGTTLNVTVTGATAGSCTGTPSDNLTVKGYGDGGDGGYGGGGGAGASTVIIYEFATSIAESVQQEAISRGPGTGGPGGKGGKGGDGCILIFY